MHLILLFTAGLQKSLAAFNGVGVTVEEGTTFIADAVVITVPLGVLKSGTINFEPKLPDWKEAAIDNIHKVTGNPALVYMPAGQLVKDIEKMSDEAAAQFAFSQLIPKLLITQIRCLASHWGTDPDSLGSYSYDLVAKPPLIYCHIRMLERYGEVDLFQPVMREEAAPAPRLILISRP
ncbi:hypothetical protein MLD38_030305 [Melastoma candidum]|uniref:Uncharacterized protein n=1 Tax=Melastoma candidum TaxID=119954 RepID=A0ACB9MLF3_9MYRT|nr:hypothetical protein MLD38_030305 [Melastoma candidum]